MPTSSFDIPAGAYTEATLYALIKTFVADGAVRSLSAALTFYTSMISPADAALQQASQQWVVGKCAPQLSSSGGFSYSSIIAFQSLAGSTTITAWGSSQTSSSGTITSCFHSPSIAPLYIYIPTGVNFI